MAQEKYAVLNSLSFPIAPSILDLETNWVDVVTTCPVGYEEDSNGDVSISTAEGLAWLISTVNGLNGQTANTFEGKTISLTDNVDISANIWTPIGNQNAFFKGTFNGNDFEIEGIYMLDFATGDNYALFGYLHNATVKNIVLKDGVVGGNLNVGTIASTSDSLSVIDKCFVSTIVNGSQCSGGIVAVNRCSTVSNCCYCANAIGAMVSTGGIVGCNLADADIADALVVNCYCVTDFASNYSSLNNGGIVGVNNGSATEKQAVVKNCYSAITGMYGVSCGNIAGRNLWGGTIENCYYLENKNPFCGVNYGDSYNISSFYLENLQWLLSEPVIIGNEIDNLLDALNAWVDEQADDEYEEWCEEDGGGKIEYPVFCFNTTAIENHETVKNTILAYPNPCKEILTLSGENICSVEVYDFEAKKILSMRFDNTSYANINVKDLKSGVYLVNVIDGYGNSYVVKILK